MLSNLNFYIKQLTDYLKFTKDKLRKARIEKHNRRLIKRLCDISNPFMPISEEKKKELVTNLANLHFDSDGMVVSKPAYSDKIPGVRYSIYYDSDINGHRLAYWVDSDNALKLSFRSIRRNESIMLIETLIHNHYLLESNEF